MQSPEMRDKKRRLMKKLNADPEFKERMREIRRQNGKRPENVARVTAIIIASAKNPKHKAKRRRTKIAKGQWLSDDKKKAIALEVRDTSDSYEAIGERHGITGSHVARLAEFYGTHRKKTGPKSQ